MFNEFAEGVVEWALRNWLPLLLITLVSIVIGNLWYIEAEEMKVPYCHYAGNITEVRRSDGFIAHTEIITDEGVSIVVDGRPSLKIGRSLYCQDPGFETRCERYKSENCGGSE